ncbi:acid phosphatase [Niveomyces insectorum RCEF 264]|uniref:Acid phosphatase n=1 Tax=Niveomyces insectorum RCEF 264 TaxID=1081102 RepID=A0A167Y482_9HYPO|nr:acid phosphatase [Niveomyces insectorum RCEF 264]
MPESPQHALDDPLAARLPDPTLAFTLPSLHDGTPLDCRVYLPPVVLAAALPSEPGDRQRNAHRHRWRGHAAVVAHPYAPLGGNYNDPIVRMVAQTLLQRPGHAPETQFVVATFNFRGVGSTDASGAHNGHSGSGGSGGGGGSSGGRTSWTAKAETADYTTVAAFLYYFVHYLDPYGVKEGTGDKEGQPKQPETTEAAVTTAAGAAAHPPPVFLCAGYSYGAMVASLLPPVPTLLSTFARPLRSSSAAEVRRCAARWAALHNADFAAPRPRHSLDLPWHRPFSPTLSPGRRSLASDRRSGEADGHGRTQSPAQPPPQPQHGPVGFPGRQGRPPEDRPDDAAGHEEQKGNHAASTLPPVSNLPAVRPAYLLVSPPVGLVTSLATLSWGMPSWGANGSAKTAGGSRLFRRKTTAATATSTATATSVNGGLPPAEAKLAAHPTLVVYGAADSLVSHRRMRQWTTKLEAASRVAAAAAVTTTTLATTEDTQTPQNSASGHLFRACEVPTAGHFWIEGRTQYALQAAVDAFAAELVGG